MKPRQCPNCSIEVGIDSGFSFDKDLNMVCDNCGRLIYPVNIMSENKIMKSQEQFIGDKWATKPGNSSRFYPTSPKDVVLGSNGSRKRTIGFRYEMPRAQNPYDSLDISRNDLYAYGIARLQPIP